VIRSLRRQQQARIGDVQIEPFYVNLPDNAPLSGVTFNTAVSSSKGMCKGMCLREIRSMHEVGP
jgi:hypothetical protein